MVTWVPEVRIHTKCEINVKDFPFDTQCCEINLYSWAHSANQMIILLYGNKNITNLTYLAKNTEWRIYNTCAMNHTIKLGNDHSDWWVTRYVIQIKRESIYHFYTLLMPCGVLSLCSLLLFWLPPASEEKITLGVTILLAFFVNSLIVSNYTPESTSELPVIGVYYTFNIFLVSLSLAGVVFALTIYYRGHTKERVPEWLRCLFRIEKLNELNSSMINKHSFKLINNNSCDSKVISFNFNHHHSHQHLYNNMSIIKPSQKLFELLSNDLKRAKEIEWKKQELELILIEWKELSRRVEFIFLVFNFLAVIFLPHFLFSKYLFRDLSADTSLQENCSCGLQ
jgi:hypothetical protein